MWKHFIGFYNACKEEFLWGVHFFYWVFYVVFHTLNYLALVVREKYGNRKARSQLHRDVIKNCNVARKMRADLDKE